MNWENVRYWIAVVILVSTPPAVLYWFVVHPFIGFWRRRGPAVTFTVVFIGYLALALVLYLAREPLLSVRGAWSPWLSALGGAAYLAAIAVELQTRRQLKLKVLVGLPEVVPSAHGPGLLTQGIYAHTRNPRYLTVMLALAGLALIVNYLAVWVLLVLMGPALRLVVYWEERELEERFGEEYLDYCCRVPRFLPRFG
jgi:protein-S-isoprenylcysteine O-methyltransferase Ste14